MEVYRVGKGGMEIGNERVRVGDGPVEVRMLGGREVYEARPGCRFPSSTRTIFKER